MKEYINPEFEIQMLASADVIATSVSVTKDGNEYLIGVSDTWWLRSRG